jgi:hypothetical protein
MKRNDGELFEEYRARRKRERDALNVHLRGVPVVTGEGTNRATRRARLFESKHKGSPDRFSAKAPARRRRMKKGRTKGI